MHAGISCRSQWVLQHPLGQKFERIAFIATKVINFCSCFLQDGLQFSLLPHNARVCGTANEFSFDKELGERSAIRFGTQSCAILISHLILGKFKSVDRNQLIFHFDSIQELTQCPTKFTVLERPNYHLILSNSFVNEFHRFGQYAR